MCIRDRYIIGFTPKTKDITIFNVWGEALNETEFVVKLVYQSFWQMITGKVGVDPVSYTHLDVYKRQRHINTVGNIHRKNGNT